MACGARRAKAVFRAIAAVALAASLSGAALAEEGAGDGPGGGREGGGADAAEAGADGPEGGGGGADAREGEAEGEGAAGAGPESRRPLKIIAGSTLLSDIVRDLLAGGAVVLTLVPPEASPSGKDLKAADAAFAADADLLLLHGFQADRELFAELVGASGNRKLRMVTVWAAGSWQVPDSQKRASEETASVLADAVPDLSGLVRVRLARRVKALEALESEARALTGPLRGVPVAASEMQAWFLRWAGMDVEWSFGGARAPGGLTSPEPPGGLMVRLVVDDLQTGGGAGESVASRLGTPLAVLSSFPGAPGDARDYFTLVKGNLLRLAAALNPPRTDFWRPL